MRDYILLLSFCNKAVLSLVNQLDTKPLSKHSLSCDLTLACKLLKLFNQYPWTKSRHGDYQFGILLRIVLKLSLVIFTFSCFVTLTSLYKSFNHFASLLWSTESLHMTPQNLFDFSASADHHHIFLLPDSIPYNTAPNYSETFCFA